MENKGWIQKLMPIETIERINSCRECYCYGEQEDGIYCYYEEEEGTKIADINTLILYFPNDCPLESVEGKTEDELREDLRQLIRTRHLRNEDGSYKLNPTPEA